MTISTTTMSPSDADSVRTPRPPNGHGRHRVAAGLALGVALFVTACGDGEPTPRATPTSVDTPAAADPSGTPVEGVSAGDPADDPAGEMTGNPAGEMVLIERSRFAPGELTVPQGTTVRFENADPYDHTVTARDDSALAFASGPFGQDEVFEQSFDAAGSYEYFCEIPPTMRAVITVQ